MTYKTYKITNMPYPFVSLFKFNTIVNLISNIKPNDKFLYADIDTIFCDNIDDDINNYNLCFNRSSWLSGRNVESYPFINYDAHKIESTNDFNFSNTKDLYCQGSFLMGTYKYLIDFNNITMSILAEYNIVENLYDATYKKVRKMPLMFDQTLMNQFIVDVIINKKYDINICTKCYFCNNYANALNVYKNFKKYYNECFGYQKYDDGIKIDKKKNSSKFDIKI